jgi:GH15 family glucan-1,4-alpha-glucosidase
VLARATTDKQRYDLAKSRAQERVQTTEVPQQQYAAPQPQRAAPQPQVDPKAQTWAEKNDWFGQDEVMTYAAFGVHRKLVEEEGFDPQSDEYYSEIDRRMRTEFPHKFQASKPSGKSQVAPAGSSASRSTKQGRRTVRLSPSQIAIAKKLNVPLEEYAKYVKD